jgi:ABC-type multidrug transport system ATPase subunit
MKLEVNNLGKRYNYQFVVRNLNLNVSSGEIAGIAGRNGSGKSTTMQMISGYLTPSEGSVEYWSGNTKIQKDSIYKHLAYAAPYIDLPQKITTKELFDHYTMFKRVCIQSYNEFNSICDLKNTDGKFIANFSSGMKQKIALALALVTDCELLLFDEPTSYLDNFSKSWFLDGIKNFGEGKTIIIASNDTSDFNSCNQIYEIK